MRTGLIVLCGAVIGCVIGLTICGIKYLVDVIRRYLR